MHSQFFNDSAEVSYTRGQAARLYEYYSAKADEQAKLAARYDDLLIRSGFEPVGTSRTVSVTTLGSRRPGQ